MIIYLLICGIIFLGMVLLGLHEDLTLKGEKPWTNLSNIYYWLITFILSCPVVNLFVAVFFIFHGIKAARDNL